MILDWDDEEVTVTHYERSVRIAVDGAAGYQWISIQRQYLPEFIKALEKYDEH